LIMARRPSKHLRPARPLSSQHAQAEHKGDGRWIVRTVAGGQATKPYRCPGCDQLIPPGTAHLVVWPDDAGWLTESPLEARRHWHTSCWRRRR